MADVLSTTFLLPQDGDLPEVHGRRLGNRDNHGLGPDWELAVSLFDDTDVRLTVPSERAAREGASQLAKEAAEWNAQYDKLMNSKPGRANW